MDARRRAFLMADAASLAEAWRAGELPALAGLGDAERDAGLAAELERVRPGHAASEYREALAAALKGASPPR